jgi:flavodoxin
MKNLILYASKHNGNTKKIAEKMALWMNGDIYPIKELPEVELDKYDTICLGSGIYHGKHDTNIFNLVEKTDLKDKKVIVFSTSGTGNKKNNMALNKMLLLKNAKILGDFSCKGLDTYGVFKWIGGISKGRPNSKDLDRLFDFCEQIINQDN